MKKIVSILLISVLAFSLVACSKPAPTATATPTPAANPKITIWAWDPNFNIAIMQQAKDRYLKINPNTEFEIVDMAKADLEQKLQTSLAAGTKEGLPDIVLVEDYNAQKYLASYPGAFADLTSKITYSDFLPYKVALMTVGGKSYGVPFDTGASGLYYRTDILAKAGYTDADLKNITWDKYIEIGKKVKEKTGKAMVAFDTTDGGLIRVMMQSAGAWYFNEKGEVNLANNPVVVEALETYKKIVDSKITKPTSGWGEWVGAFNKGDSASVVTGVWITGSVKAEPTQKGLWKVAATPRLNNSASKNASNLGGSSWYVLESSKSKDASIDFLNQIYGKDVDFYQQILTEKGAVGSYIPSQGGTAYSQPDEFFGGQKVFEDFSAWMKEIPATNYGVNTYEVDNAIFAVMPKILDGSMTVKDALTAAEAQAKSAIQ